jgi:phosphopantetheinyl transferase (holo-ACP synthase)
VQSTNEVFATTTHPSAPPAAMAAARWAAREAAMRNVELTGLQRVAASV